MKAFVITPFTAERAGREAPDVFAAVQAAIVEAAARAGVELVHPAQINRPGVIMDQVGAELDAADLVVAVLTGQNPNVFYELGRARRPAILVCRSREDVPFDVRHWRYWTYGGPGELETLRERLEGAMRATLAGPEQSPASRERAQQASPTLRADTTAAFVGPTERGPLRPALVTSFTEFVEVYGEPLAPDVTYLALAVRGFFDNGGRQAVVVRVVSPEARPAVWQTRNDDGQSLAIWARDPGTWGNRIEVRVRPGTRIGVRLTVVCPSAGPGAPRQEDYDNASVEANGPNPLHERVNQHSELIFIRYDMLALPQDLHTVLAGGVDGPPLRAEDYVGTASAGLELVGAMDDIDIVCVPDHVHPSLSPTAQERFTDALVDLCERRGDRIALVATTGAEHDPQRLKPRHDARYAATYYPWVRSDVDGVLVPPVGHVAGAFARHDAEKGLHLAPLGIALRGLAEPPLEIEADPERRDTLARMGVNALVVDPDSRQPCLTTAFNLAIDERLRYINVSRFDAFLRRRLTSGLSWTEFEPHGPPLYARIVEEISAFLRSFWDAGILAGERLEEAFLVRCDHTTMTDDDVANRRLIAVCAVALTGPPVTVWLEIRLRSGAPVVAPGG